MPGDHVCPECGALSCREKYESMLALEFQDPAVFGAVHHVTVICYNLQHPSAFSEEALEWMRYTLRAVVEGGLSARGLRERSQKQFRGGVRVLSKSSTAPARTDWPVTVADIRTNDPKAYVEDVLGWAKAILKS